MKNADGSPTRFTKHRVAELTSVKHAEMPNRNPSLSSPRAQDAKVNSVRFTTTSTRHSEGTNMKSTVVISERAARLKTKGD